LIRLFVFIILIYFLYKIINVVTQSKSAENKIFQFKSTSSEGEDLVEDPNCHTYVPISQAYKKEISGKDYYFCSKRCSDKYTVEKNN
jgi:YHS domain-containing protein